MSEYEANIEKDAFKAASIAQSRRASAKECLEIGIHHAVESMAVENIRASYKKLHTELYDLQHGITEAIASIEMEKQDTNDCAYNDGINTALEIIRDHIKY